MLDICLLGCGGMLPLPKRYLTSLLIRYNGKSLLIDCGEGTQMPLYQSSFSVKDIEGICFTHYHGDHITGLPGLLMTMGNSNRTEPLHLYGGEGLKHFVGGLLVVCPHLPFEIVYHELTFHAPCEFEIMGLRVKTMPVKHRVPCMAFSVELDRLGKFDVQRAQKLDLPVQYWKVLQNGAEVEYNNRIYYPHEVMGPARKGLKVSYATDCRPAKELVDFVSASDLLVAEGLYGDSEKQPSAKEKGHMVYAEAAQMAKEANVKELWFTHYSPAMTNPKEFLDEAKEIFPNCHCGKNLREITLRFSEEEV